jgi:hypothetical protein
MAPAAPKDPAEVSWHFDRRIPIALIVTIIVQTGAAIWWASSVTSFMVESQRTASALADRVKAVETDSDSLDRRLVRFEVLLEGQTDQLKEQRQILTQIRDSVGAPAKK